MTAETLETVVEELVNALNIERWKRKMAEAEISELKKQNEALLKERNNG